MHLHVHTGTPCSTALQGFDDLLTSKSSWYRRRWRLPTTGNLYSAYDFWKRSKAAGVKPIIGMEATTPPGRFEQSPFDFGAGFDGERMESGESSARGRHAYTHMTVLAETTPCTTSSACRRWRVSGLLPASTLQP